MIGITMSASDWHWMITLGNPAGDVYKRQLQILAEFHFFFIWSFDREETDAIFPERKEMYFIPVSYTHLDVYKRQC